MGILVNDGMRKPNMLIESLHFGAATPYETVLHYKPGQGEQVLAPEVAQAVRGAIRRVVEEGTAQRVKDAFVRPDGSFVSVGGKTGTGDQRFDTFGAGGRLVSSRVVNRSATFVFNIDERFFGTLIAFVPGAQAADYDFTSGLPVQLLKVLAPQLMPMIQGRADETVALSDVLARQAGPADPLQVKLFSPENIPINTTMFTPVATSNAVAPEARVRAWRNDPCDPCLAPRAASCVRCRCLLPSTQ
jgi:hypothetical protein